MPTQSPLLKLRWDFGIPSWEKEKGKEKEIEIEKKREKAWPRRQTSAMNLNEASSPTLQTFICVFGATATHAFALLSAQRLEAPSCVESLGAQFHSTYTEVEDEEKR